MSEEFWVLMKQTNNKLIMVGRMSWRVGNDLSIEKKGMSTSLFLGTALTARTTSALAWALARAAL